MLILTLFTEHCSKEQIRTVRGWWREAALLEASASHQLGIDSLKLPPSTFVLRAPHKRQFPRRNRSEKGRKVKKASASMMDADAEERYVLKNEVTARKL